MTDSDFDFEDLPAPVRIRLNQSADQRTAASLAAAASALYPSLYDASIPLAHRVVQAADTELLAVLLALGSPPEMIDDEGWSPLHLAAALDDATAVGILLAAGANPRSSIPCGALAGWTPLHLLAHAGHSASPIATMLRDAGADPDTMAADGTSPRMLQALADAARSVLPC